MVTGVRPGHAHSTFGRVPSRHSAAYIHPSHKAVVCVCPKTMTRVQQPEYELAGRSMKDVYGLEGRYFGGLWVEILGITGKSDT